MSAEQVNTFSQGNVDEIFRIMHTIKGSSAMMQFNPLMTVAHRIEDLFFIIRESGMDILSEQSRSDLFDLVLQATDYFRNEVEKLNSNEPLSEDIDSFLTKINSCIVKIKGEIEGVPVASIKLEPTYADTSPEESIDQPESILVADNHEFPYSLLIFFDEGCGMESLRAFMLVNSIRDFCMDSEFTFTPNDVETNPESSETIIENGFVLQFRNANNRECAIQAITNSSSIRTYQTADYSAPTPLENTAPANTEEVPSTEKTSANPATPSDNTTSVPSKPSTASTNSAASNLSLNSSKESFISVNLSKLDQLMAVVGEIVITESMVTGSPDLNGLKLDNFTKSARQLRKLTDELQDVSMSLRMVPVSGTFQKMNRIVRDMGKKLGKRVKLTLTGEETEVDKSIVDGISDSIMHIVRNSMDHGIETDEEDRIAAGKDPVGEIILSARHTGSEVIIEIKDDGQGINYDRVLQKALSQRLASPDLEYSTKEIINFLLMPGFSTNTDVTEFSGRGVGMDVVKKSVEGVGGTLFITSDPGVGMTTTLKIPLTMAIMDGMKVSVGNSIFTIPIHNIRQSFKVNPDDIIHDGTRSEMIKCIDNFYPIVRIKDLYGLDLGFDEIQDGILIWVESGEISYCLFVDELIGEQQVVVKPLPSYVNTFNIKNHGITGCTILGDGNISIILDVANLYLSIQ
ncbi:MAG: cheA [Evtepia sp.]|nr:cheA [Evtepia sp.]